MSAIRNSRARDLVAATLMVAGVGAALIAPLILFIELFEWLTRSEWPGLTLADGLSIFGIERAAAETESQRLEDLLMAAPLTVAMFLTGIYLFLFGASLGRLDRERELLAELSGRPMLERLTLWGAEDVSYPTAFRLLFLTLLLRGLLWLGLGLLIAEVVLHVLGAELRWLGISGLLVMGPALIAQAWVRRKLPSLED